MTTDTQTLDALVSVVAACRRTHLVGIFPSLSFTLAAFESLLDSPALDAGNIRLARESTSLPPRLFTDNEGKVRPDAVRKLYRQDVSIVLIGIEKLLPAIGLLADTLAARTGQNVQTNAYLTGGSHAALKPHYDGHDVLVVQIAGAKHWYCYGPDPCPDRKGGAVTDVGDRSPQWEATVTTGDVLYLPRGEIHSAAPLKTPSLHLAFGVKRDLLAESAGH